MDRARDAYRPNEDLGARGCGAPLKDWGGHPNLVPAQVGEDVLGDVRQALARHQREREGRVDERFAELGLGGVVLVEVDRHTVLRVQNAPGCGLVRRYQHLASVVHSSREHKSHDEAVRPDPPDHLTE